MRSTSLIVAFGFLLAGCARPAVVPDVASPPAPVPAATTPALLATRAPSDALSASAAAPPALETRSVALADPKATADDVASAPASRNARTAPAEAPPPSEPPFVERSAIEALDRVAYVFHVENEGRRKKIALATDPLFAPGSAVLEPSITAAWLDRLATALKAQGPHLIRVEAFTDSLGEREENRALSEQRANALRDYFLAQGVKPDRIVAEGRGATHPVASNATADGRASNRRVEIWIE
jgi:outer membrane protein OmpA-like peptidoglycan-associated protein